MKTITPQLPTVLGSFSAMLVAFLSLLNGTSPGVCLMKAMAAFLVFAGFGLILRYALLDAAAEQTADAEDGPARLPGSGSNLDVIVPGTSVAELLASHGGDAQDEEQAAA